MTRVAGAVPLVIGLALAASALRASGSPATEPQAQGAALFVAKGCVACHSAPGIASHVGIGPDLALVPRAEEYIRTSIVEPGARRALGYAAAGAATMPELPVSERELDLLVAFLMGEDG